jgi:hypothetical protein
MSPKSPKYLKARQTPPRHPPPEVLLMFEPSHLTQGCLATAYARLVPRTLCPARTTQTTQTIPMLPTLDQLEPNPVPAFAELISVSEPGEFGGTLA